MWGQEGRVGGEKQEEQEPAQEIEAGVEVKGEEASRRRTFLMLHAAESGPGSK